MKTQPYLSSKETRVPGKCSKVVQLRPSTTPGDDSVKICGTFQDKLIGALIKTNPISSYWKKNTRTISIIDIAIPNDANISRKRNDKITNYANLAIELKPWNVHSVKTVLIMIGACGTIHQTFEKLICEKLDIKINTNEIHHMVLLSTTNISGCFFLYRPLKTTNNPQPHKIFLKNNFS